MRTGFAFVTVPTTLRFCQSSASITDFQSGVDNLILCWPGHAWHTVRSRTVSLGAGGYRRGDA